MQRYFEDILSKHDSCLVIGFSFRDPLINNIFLDFLRANSKKRLVVVSPNAIRDIEENLTIGEPQLGKQVTSLNMLFGGEEILETIRDALTHEPKKKEEEKNQKNLIRI